MFSWLFMIGIDNDDTLRDANLHCRQANARCVVHGQDHIVDQLDDITSNVFDRSTRLFEARVRKMQDLSNHFLTYNMLYGSTSTMTRTPCTCCGVNSSA